MYSLTDSCKTDPAHPDRPIAFFSDVKSAWEHLRDQLLPHLSQLKYEHWTVLRQRCVRTAKWKNWATTSKSRVPGTGKLRFIEVKGRVAGTATITVTRNEILYSLNKKKELER